MNRSMNDSLKCIYHWAKTVSATETPSAGEDLQGMATAEIICAVGAVTNIANSPQPSWTLKLEHSDASGSGFAAVAETDVALKTGNNDGSLSSGVFATIDAAAEDDLVYRLAYIGAKRYIRVVATAANTPGNTPISVVIVGEPNIEPGTDAA